MKVFIVSIIKNEARYLHEWICFHRAVGIDHFVLYDNRSTDETRDLLAPYVQEGLVTLIDWPKPTGQMPAYIHAIGMFGKAADWFCVIDADEFVVPKAHDTVQDYLAGFEASQVYLPWRVFGFSGHRTRPEGLLIENFTTAEKLALKEGTKIHTKFFVRPEAVKVVGVHSCLLKEGHETVDWEGAPAKSGDFPMYRPYDSIQLNHYYYKSYEEYCEKIERGSATGALVKQRVPFEALDKTHGDIDESAMKFLGKTRETVAYFEGLPPRLLKYGRKFSNRGEQLVRMPYFSDLYEFDPWRWFATRAAMNLLNGEPNVRSDFQNLPAKGRGNRFSIAIETAPDADEWAQSVHFRHLKDISGSDWMEESAAPRPAGHLVLNAPQDQQRRCYSAIALVKCDSDEGGTVRVVGRLPGDQRIAHAVHVEPGLNLVFCEISDEPIEIDRLKIVARDQITPIRMIGVRYA